MAGGGEDGFRHEALFYAGDAEYRAQATSFIRGALRREEPTLVVVRAAKIDLLRAALGDQADGVEFADMADVGRNPARIIPIWRAFADRHAAAGRRLRGIGEPVWPGRTPDELVECERHESLLNLAFAEAPAWWLVCPYDTTTLAPAVLDEARSNHPFVLDGGMHRESTTFRDATAQPFDRALPEPDAPMFETRFEPGDLGALRRVVARLASAFDLSPARRDDLVLAVDEVATNSLLHADGEGILRIWPTTDALICEIRDRGRIPDPLAGRERPARVEASSGLWLVNQLCDLVQLRSFPTGSVVRLHMSMAAVGS